MESLGGGRRGALQQGKGVHGEGLPNRGRHKDACDDNSLGKSISVTTVTFWEGRDGRISPVGSSPEEDVGEMWGLQRRLSRQCCIRSCLCKTGFKSRCYTAYLTAVP